MLLQTQTAGASLRVANYVGDGFPNRHGQYALLQCGERDLGRLAFHGDACGFEGGLGLREFGGQSLRAIAADGVADFRERLAGNLFDLANFVAGARGIAVDQLSGEFGFQDDDGERVPEHVVQIAGDALALGDFGEVLNFVVSHAQLGESSDCAARSRYCCRRHDERHSTGVEKEPAAERWKSYLSIAADGSNRGIAARPQRSAWDAEGNKAAAKIKNVAGAGVDGCDSSPRSTMPANAPGRAGSPGQNRPK